MRTIILYTLSSFLAVYSERVNPATVTQLWIKSGVMTPAVKHRKLSSALSDDLDGWDGGGGWEGGPRGRGYMYTYS